MLALLHCTSPACRATFEAEGTRQAIDRLSCPDCGGPLQAKGWADAAPREGMRREAQLRRAA